MAKYYLRKGKKDGDLKALVMIGSMGKSPLPPFHHITANAQQPP